MARATAVRSNAGSESHRDQRLPELVALHRRYTSGSARKEPGSTAKFSESIAASRSHDGIPLHAPGPIAGCALTEKEESCPKKWRFKTNRMLPMQIKILADKFSMG